MIVGDIIQLYVKTFPSVVEFFNSKKHNYVTSCHAYDVILYTLT